LNIWHARRWNYCRTMFGQIIIPSSHHHHSSASPKRSSGRITTFPSSSFASPHRNHCFPVHPSKFLCITQARPFIPIWNQFTSNLHNIMTISMNNGAMMLSWFSLVMHSATTTTTTMAFTVAPKAITTATMAFQQQQRQQQRPPMMTFMDRPMPSLCWCCRYLGRSEHRR
jgi:hypothetical protein